MEIAFVGEVIEWRGPAPFMFVRVPEQVSAEIKELSGRLSYGWGCITVEAEFGETRVRTALMPKDGAYLVPVKVVVQKAEGVEIGQMVGVRLFFELAL